MEKRLWKTAAIAGSISVLLAVILLVGVVWLSLRAEEPERRLGIWVTLAVTLGGAVSGVIGARMHASAPLYAALLSGLTYVVVVCLLCLPFGEGFCLGTLLTNALLPVAVAGLAGRLLCAKGTTRRANHKKAARHASKIYKGKR